MKIKPIYSPYNGNGFRQMEITIHYCRHLLESIDLPVFFGQLLACKKRVQIIINSIYGLFITFSEGNGAIFERSLAQFQSNP